MSSSTHLLPLSELKCLFEFQRTVLRSESCQPILAQMGYSDINPDQNLIVI